MHLTISLLDNRSEMVLYHFNVSRQQAKVLLILWFLYYSDLCCNSAVLICVFQKVFHILLHCQIIHIYSGSSNVMSHKVFLCEESLKLVYCSGDYSLHNLHTSFIFLLFLMKLMFCSTHVM